MKKMIYTAKPNLLNSKGKKSFDNPVDACVYLNERLVGYEGDQSGYIFRQLSVSKNNLQNTIEEFCGIGKLFIEEV